MYDKNNLGVLSYSNGFTMWHYRTTDYVTEVKAAGYFNESGNRMRVGDVIIANMGTMSAPTTAMLTVYAASTGKVATYTMA